MASGVTVKWIGGQPVGFSRKKKTDKEKDGKGEAKEKVDKWLYSGKIPLQSDPLDVYQMILKILQRSDDRGDPISSVHDLANLITNSCLDVFDTYKVPSEFQFFDFFERSIRAAVSIS